MDRIALRGDQVAVGRAAEIARAGIAKRAARHGNLKKSVAVQRHVERAAGGLERALGLDPGGRLKADAGAQVQPGGIGRFGRGLLPGHPRVLIGQGGEIGAVALEPGGADVGEVVGDHPHPLVLGLEAGAGDVKGGTGHWQFSGGVNLGRWQRRKFRSSASRRQSFRQFPWPC
jgi:hypothetical protein